MKGIPDLHNCRAPNCRFKAPVCTYGYCSDCCHKHHNYAILGQLSNHKKPDFEAIQYGYKVVEHGYTDRIVTPAVVYKPPEPEVILPVCGKVEVISHREYPLEEKVYQYARYSDAWE